MDSLNNNCDHCQLLEKKILEANSSVKKLLSLKSKIINTDTLIRKYKEQKDEAEKLQTDKQQLIEEREKSERLCTKYEIDLKLALEEVHSLRQCEKEYKTAATRFESEITSLRDSLQAERALVKQYKSLVEKDEKAEEQMKDKAVKELEKKLSKKEDEVQKSKERTRYINRKLTMVSKSHVKALKFIQKLGNHPALQGILPAGDKRTLNNFDDALQKNALFKTTDDNLSNDEDDEFLDESQYLEDLLMEKVQSEKNCKEISTEVIPNGQDHDMEANFETSGAKHVQHDALDSTTDLTNRKNGSSGHPVLNQTNDSQKKILDDFQKTVTNLKANHNQCDSPDSTSPVELFGVRNMPTILNGHEKEKTIGNPVKDIKKQQLQNPLEPCTKTEKDPKSLTDKENDLRSLTNTENDLKSLTNTENDLKSLTNAENDLKSLTNTENNLKSLTNAENDLKSLTNTENNLKSFTNAENEPNSLRNVGSSSKPLPKTVVQPNTNTSNIVAEKTTVTEKTLTNNTCSLSNQTLAHNVNNNVVIVPMETDSVTIVDDELNFSTDLAKPIETVKEIIEENKVQNIKSDTAETCPMEVESCELDNVAHSATVNRLEEIPPDVSHVLNCVVNSALESVCDSEVAQEKGVSNATEKEVTSDLASKDEVIMSNTESEFEEGELVIASDHSVAEEPTERKLTSAEMIRDSPESPERPEDRCVIEDTVVNELNLFRELSDTASEKQSIPSENSIPVQRGSLPLIPFSEDRQFKPTSKGITDASSLLKDDTDASSNVNTNSHRKNKRSERRNSKVDKICSRMKNAVVLEFPVSPLPPSPPNSPVETSFSQSVSDILKEDNGASKEKCDNINELFGSDSDEDFPNRFCKSLLQHQESEGFEPEAEHQDELVDDQFRKQNPLRRRESLQRLVQKSKELQILNRNGTERTTQDETIGCRDNVQIIQQPRLESNTRLFTDFSMDPGSGRCQISIRLPDNMNSATNVRFELDTLSKQIHLDYGPSQFDDWKNFRHPNSPVTPKCKLNNSSESSSPKVTFPDETPCQKRSSNCSTDKDNCPTIHKSSNSIISQCRPIRRQSVPPIGHALQRLAAQRRVVTFEDHDKETNCNSTESSTAVFKTPALRKQNACVVSKNTCSSSTDVNSSSTPNLTTKLHIEPQEISAPQTNNNKRASSIGSTETNPILQSATSDNNKPKKKKGKKRKNKSPNRPNDNPKKMTCADPADKKEGPPLHLPANPNVLKALQTLLQVKYNKEASNNKIFTKLFKSLCSAELCPTPDDLVTAAMVFFSACPVNILPVFLKKKDSQVPLLTPKEEVFVALIKHLQDQQAHLTNAIGHFLSCVSVQMNQALEACPTGLASLCRIHTVLCRQEGYVQMSQDLCYHLVLRKHPHAAFLIANVLVVWPNVLELLCSSAHWNLRKKIFSLFLLGSPSNVDEPTITILNDLGQLQYTEETCVPDSLAMEMVKLLRVNDDLRGIEDVCQQLLLLAYMQGWPWTKEKVLPSILDIFEAATGNNNAPVIRLIGSFLHYCGPKSKEESDFLVQKLQTKFQTLDDKDFLPKEACSHSLLSLANQMEHATLMQMKTWLQNHRDKLSTHLRDDFVSSGFLT